ncbi:hypothetical protein P4571_02375 [Niallia alba]|nr:hypothetical protein [Niallia alba]
MAFIKRMNAKVQRNKRKSGVHQANENQNAEEQTKKWRSSSE